jgi:integrase
MPLNDTRIRGAAKKVAPYKLADEKGLYLEVRPTGAKFWRYRYRIDSKENVYTFGEYAVAPAGETAEQAQARRAGGRYTLDEARQERVIARGLVRQGIHPKQARLERVAAQAERGDTFEVIAREWLERNRAKWTTRHHDDVTRQLESDVFPALGSKPIRQVSAADVLRVLDGVASGTAGDRSRGAPVVAINLRQWCGAIFAHAVRTLRADGDPTGVLKGHIERPRVKHKKPLTKVGVRELVMRIEGAGYITTKFALKLLLYTFVRPGEMRQAEWCEFDLEAAVWTIPAEKMKKRETHLVPLSRQAIEILRALRHVSGNRQHLFPNHHRPNDCLSANALNQTLRRLGYAGEFTAHAFRATASTELHELGYRSELIEFQLAHADRDQTRASYNQAQFWNERRAMMQQWADLVDAWCGDENVVAVNAHAASAA